MKALLLIIALLVPFAPAACNSAVEQPTPPQAQTTAPAPEVPQEPMELTGIELHKVKLAAPHKIRAKDQKERVFDQAWLVLLSFKNRLPARNARTDIYIGDYRVPEYGGHRNGVYFKIYDENLLRSLNDQEVSIAVAGKKKQSLGRKFSTADYARLSVEEESAVLKR
jgi:hypothetical protein